MNHWTVIIIGSTIIEKWQHDFPHFQSLTCRIKVLLDKGGNNGWQDSKTLFVQWEKLGTTEIELQNNIREHSMFFFTFPTIFHYISWACFFNPHRGIACFFRRGTRYIVGTHDMWWIVVDIRRGKHDDWYTAHVYFV